MLRVRVALVSGGYPELMPPHDAQGPDIPYGQRASVALRVGEDESMLSMFGRALNELGVAFAEPEDVVGGPVNQVSLLAFYKPEDDAGSPLQERFIYPQHLLTVPADGRIRWGSLLREARVADVARAGAHG